MIPGKVENSCSSHLGVTGKRNMPFPSPSSYLILCPLIIRTKKGIKGGREGPVIHPLLN